MDNKTLHIIGDLLISEIRQNLRADDNYATGELDKSFKKIVRNGKLKIYAGKALWAVSEGTLPSQKSPSPNMVDRVSRWMRARGMQPLVRKYKKNKDGTYEPTGRFRSRGGYSAMQTAAYSISKSILRKGLKGSDVVRRSYSRVEKEIGEESMNYIRNQIKTQLGEVKIKELGKI